MLIIVIYNLFSLYFTSISEIANIMNPLDHAPSVTPIGGSYSLKPSSDLETILLILFSENSIQGFLFRYNLKTVHIRYKTSGQ